MVTGIQRELDGVVEYLATLVAETQGSQNYPEELIPPMTDDPDEIIENATVTKGGVYDHQGDMAGFTLWRGDKGYRVIVSKIPD